MSLQLGVLLLFILCEHHLCSFVEIPSSGLVNNAFVSDIPTSNTMVDSDDDDDEEEELPTEVSENVCVYMLMCVSVCACV